MDKENFKFVLSCIGDIKNNYDNFVKKSDKDSIEEMKKNIEQMDQYIGQINKLENDLAQLVCTCYHRMTGKCC